MYFSFALEIFDTLAEREVTRCEVLFEVLELLEIDEQ